MEEPARLFCPWDFPSKIYWSGLPFPSPGERNSSTSRDWNRIYCVSQILYPLSHNQIRSVTQSCPTLCDPVNHSTPGLPVHHQLPEFTQTHVHQVSDAIQPSHPLSFLSPPTVSLSQHQGLFKWISSLHQVAKILEFSFSISPSNEYSGLISFRMDLLDLLAVQEILKSLLQDHSSKASILQCSAFFMVQLSYPYMTTGKTIALIRQTFVSKVISLLFNTLSEFAIAFLPRSKHLIISWAPKSLWTVIVAMKL